MIYVWLKLLIETITAIPLGGFFIIGTYKYIIDYSVFSELCKHCNHFLALTITSFMTFMLFFISLPAIKQDLCSISSCENHHDAVSRAWRIIQYQAHNQTRIKNLQESITNISWFDEFIANPDQQQNIYQSKIFLEALKVGTSEGWKIVVDSNPDEPLLHLAQQELDLINMGSNPNIEFAKSEIERKYNELYDAWSNLRENYWRNNVDDRIKISQKSKEIDFYDINLLNSDQKREILSIRQYVKALEVNSKSAWEALAASDVTDAVKYLAQHESTLFPMEPSVSDACHDQAEFDRSKGRGFGELGFFFHRCKSTGRSIALQGMASFNVFSHQFRESGDVARQLSANTMYLLIKSRVDIGKP